MKGKSRDFFECLWSFGNPKHLNRKINGALYSKVFLTSVPRISQRAACRDLQEQNLRRLATHLLIYSMFVEEGVAGAGRGSTSSEWAHTATCLWAYTFKWTRFMKFKQSHQVMACFVSFLQINFLQISFPVSNRSVRFAGNSPRLHEVLMELLNWETHSARLMRHIPRSLGAAEGPKLILNLLKIEGAQLPQQLCPDDTRWGFFEEWPHGKRMKAFTASSAFPNDCG